MINSTDDILGIDYGAKRIGIARISPVAKIGQPLVVIEANDSAMEQIQAIVSEYGAQACVVGLPRGLDGQDTDQTRQCEDFSKQLNQYLSVPVYMIDEAGSSKVAQQRIDETDSKAGLDAVAAAVFVEDFINHQDNELLLVQ
jgi:putative Holliday junction resolvase